MGDGTSATVKLCKSIKTQKLYADKIFKEGDEEMINIIIRTFQIHRLLKHKYIIKAYELFIDENTENHHLILEYANFPTLTTFLESTKDHLLTEIQAKTIIRSIL